MARALTGPGRDDRASCFVCRGPKAVRDSAASLQDNDGGIVANRQRRSTRAKPVLVDFRAPTVLLEAMGRIVDLGSKNRRRWTARAERVSCKGAIAAPLHRYSLRPR